MTIGDYRIDDDTAAILRNLPEPWELGPDDRYGVDYPGECNVCGGETGALGTLGRRVHLLCRDCGAQSSYTVTE